MHDDRDDGDAASTAAPLSDATLIAWSAAGDTAAFSLLTGRHSTALTRYCATLTHDFTSLGQRALTGCWTSMRAGFGPTGSFRLYALIAAKRLHSADQHGRPATSLTDIGRPFGVPPALDTLTATVVRAFHALPERHQMLMWHIAVEGAQPQDVAQYLGGTAEHAESLYAHARDVWRAGVAGQASMLASSPECSLYANLLSRFLADTLDAHDRNLVANHVGSCASCWDVLRAMTQVSSTLRHQVCPWVLGDTADAYVVSLRIGGEPRYLGAPASPRQTPAEVTGRVARHDVPHVHVEDLDSDRVRDPHAMTPPDQSDRTTDAERVIDLRDGTRPPRRSALRAHREATLSDGTPAVTHVQSSAGVSRDDVRDDASAPSASALDELERMFDAMNSDDADRSDDSAVTSRDEWDTARALQQLLDAVGGPEEARQFREAEASRIAERAGSRVPAQEGSTVDGVSRIASKSDGDRRERTRRGTPDLEDFVNHDHFAETLRRFEEATEGQPCASPVTAAQLLASARLEPGHARTGDTRSVPPDDEGASQALGELAKAVNEVVPPLVHEADAFAAASPLNAIDPLAPLDPTALSRNAPTPFAPPAAQPGVGQQAPVPLEDPMTTKVKSQSTAADGAAGDSDVLDGEVLPVGGWLTDVFDVPAMTVVNDIDTSYNENVQPIDVLSHPELFLAADAAQTPTRLNELDPATGRICVTVTDAAVACSNDQVAADSTPTDDLEQAPDTWVEKFLTRTLTYPSTLGVAMTTRNFDTDELNEVHHAATTDADALATMPPPSSEDVAALDPPPGFSGTVWQAADTGQVPGRDEVLSMVLPRPLKARSTAPRDDSDAPVEATTDAEKDLLTSRGLAADSVLLHTARWHSSDTSATNSKVTGDTGLAALVRREPAVVLPLAPRLSANEPATGLTAGNGIKLDPAAWHDDEHGETAPLLELFPDGSPVYRRRVRLQRMAYVVGSVAAATALVAGSATLLVLNKEQKSTDVVAEPGASATQDPSATDSAEWSTTDVDDMPDYPGPGIPADEDAFFAGDGEPSDEDDTAVDDPNDDGNIDENVSDGAPGDHIVADGPTTPQPTPTDGPVIDDQLPGNDGGPIVRDEEETDAPKPTDTLDRPDETESPSPSQTPDPTDSTTTPPDDDEESPTEDPTQNPTEGDANDGAEGDTPGEAQLGGTNQGAAQHEGGNRAAGAAPAEGAPAGQ